jgi:hypothetical protein
VLKGRRAVARLAGRARAGRNTLRLRAPAGPGGYTLALAVSAAYGQRATTRVRLTVNKPGGTRTRASVESPRR